MKELFNFDFIFSQLSEGANTTFQTQEKFDAKLKKAQKEIRQYSFLLIFSQFDQDEKRVL